MSEIDSILHYNWYRQFLLRLYSKDKCIKPVNHEHHVLLMEERAYHPYLASLMWIQKIRSIDYKEQLVAGIKKDANQFIDSGHYVTHEFDHKDITGFANDVLKLLVLFEGKNEEPPAVCDCPDWTKGSSFNKRFTSPTINGSSCGCPSGPGITPGVGGCFTIDDIKPGIESSIRRDIPKGEAEFKNLQKILKENKH